MEGVGFGEGVVGWREEDEENKDNTKEEALCLSVSLSQSPSVCL